MHWRVTIVILSVGYFLLNMFDFLHKKINLLFFNILFNEVLSHYNHFFKNIITFLSDMVLPRVYLFIFLQFEQLYFIKHI